MPRHGEATSVWQRPWLRIALAAVLALAVALAIVEWTVEHPLRRYLERRINASLRGYTVAIGRLDLQLLGFAVVLEDVTLVQDARPSPPMLDLPRWRTSLEWRALLSLALVADTTFDRPTIYITREQSAEEARDAVPVEDRGWQDALQAVYPLEINSLHVVEGDVSYYDVGNVPPIHLQHVDFRATNIRNVRSARGTYPSPVALHAAVLGGSIAATGHADFLAKPHPALATDVEVSDVDLVPLAPIARRWDLTLERGSLHAAGRMVWQTTETVIDLRRVELDEPAITYARNPREDRRHVEHAVESAAEAATGPGIRVDIEDVRIRGGTFALELDALRSADGRTIYAEAKDLPPLRLEDVDLHVTDVGSEPRQGGPPTRFELRCRALRDGRLAVTGTADLLARPTPTVIADFELRRIRLLPFAPLARHWAFELGGGELRAAGRLEVASRKSSLLLRRVVLAHPAVSYVQRTRDDERRLDTATRGATEARSAPAFRLDVDDARIRAGRFAFVDARADPQYRLALTDSDVAVRGFSNQRAKRRGSATLRGRFMRTGSAAIDATFASPEFDMKVRLEDVQLTELNDLLRARAGFDAASGRFSFYSELAVQNGRVHGYVKPFFEDLDVYDRRQDAGKGLGAQAYEALVGAAGTVLENRPRDQIATRADLSGPIDDPDAPTWQIVIGLLRNAFWRALMPGLDHTAAAR
jgi:hypothetical protein